MSERRSFVGVLGYRRSRHNVFGGRVRLVTIRDGVLRISDDHGKEIERVDVAASTVQLTRGMVRVVDGGRTFYLHGISPVKIPKKLIERVRSEPADIVVGAISDGVLRTPYEIVGDTFHAIAASKATFAMLLTNGARAA